MKRFAIATLLLCIASTALAVQPRAYQITGPILEIKGDMVIVHYQMKAKSIEVK